MGSPPTEKSHGDDETIHQVTLTSDYYVGKFEVTQGQWKAVMGSNPSYFSSCGDDCPVDMVSWNDVAGSGGFIERLNAYLAETGQLGEAKLRLPTEAEWERAARGGTQTRFSFGDALEGNDGCGANAAADPYVWWCWNSGNSHHPVGIKAENPFGLYDVHGNVWEYVSDWYAAYGEGAQTDPAGPAAEGNRVARGGSAGNSFELARSACRLFINPIRPDRNVGFRLARSL
jgi:formylglycine-generating enzyme required for sulfatase activity